MHACMHAGLVLLAHPCYLVGIIVVTRGQHDLLASLL